MEAVDRLVRRLRENGAGSSAPQPGELMQPFHLPDENGRIVSLDLFLVKGPVAVTFHRRHWCPYCRININVLSRAQETIVPEDGQILAVMLDRQHFVSGLKSAGKVSFPILTDMDNGYALSLNLAIWLGAEIQKMLAGHQDLPSFQGNNSWILPIPATFVVVRTASSRRVSSILTTEGAWQLTTFSPRLESDINSRILTGWAARAHFRIAEATTERCRLATPQT